MVFRRKWVERQPFYKLGYGQKFYGDLGGGLWYGPMLKIRGRQYSYLWNQSSGGQGAISVANTSVTTAKFPEPFRDYNGDAMAIPNPD